MAAAAMTRTTRWGVVLSLATLACVACGRRTSPTTATPVEPLGGQGMQRFVYLVLFTHIEDNTPAGILGTSASRTSYLNLRARLLEMAALARRYTLKWSLQPDWKFLLAAQQYEDAAATSSTGGMNILRYLRDVMGVAIDPHSHESGGYNYTDVAYLLETLGVGGSTVIGGHIWDPAFPQFQQWERFRVPVSGMTYPQATWRGDILMGSGTPNHVNDPIVSGVWHPKDRFNYWVDDPAGNIVGVGAFKSDVDGISELTGLSRAGQIDATCMLTSSIPIMPADLNSPGGLTTIESTVLGPVAARLGEIVATDFTAMVNTWRQQYGGRGCIYMQSTR